MPNFLEGEILLINKPKHWTSFDIVKKVRSILYHKLGLKKVKVGHAGTLDPLATGLLILCTGKKTKIIESIQSTKKEYSGIIQLGGTTPSYDLETAVENEKSYDHLEPSQISAAANSFIGSIHQFPPKFSAIKIDGQRAYKAARKGQDIEIKSKIVQIDQFEIVKVDLPEVHFKVVCSKGTYIRSLAHDLGERLKVGGYLKELKRNGIGEYRLEDAIDVEDFERQLQSL
ncbi:MAG: tRNA pseudouridine(55) synthase TruB [Verrucomicrobia bacterium]|nr:tRNA pseudouridine(55) synthase TruB [Verrucomicrobiota bacterium]